MTTIAKLTKQKDGKLTGTLSTLALHAANITFVPEKSENEKAPAYRVLIGEAGAEIGAGWKRTSKAGKAYISVKLDDPSFAQPIYCVLVRVGEDYQLDWNRQSSRTRTKNAENHSADF